MLCSKALSPDVKPSQHCRCPGYPATDRDHCIPKRNQACVTIIHMANLLLCMCMYAKEIVALECSCQGLGVWPAGSPYLSSYNITDLGRNWGNQKMNFMEDRTFFFLLVTNSWFEEFGSSSSSRNQCSKTGL